MQRNEPIGAETLLFTPPPVRWLIPGLRKIRSHDLRHPWAGLPLKQGVPMKQIREWLGHRGISTTADIYAHLDAHSKQPSAETMARALTLPESGMQKRW